MAEKQRILLAGATGSIGYSAAVPLAKRNARVVLLGRKAEKLSSRADSIRQTLIDAGVKYKVTDIATLVIDFSDRDSVRPGGTFTAGDADAERTVVGAVEFCKLLAGRGEATGLLTTVVPFGHHP